MYIVITISACMLVLSSIANGYGVGVGEMHLRASCPLVYVSGEFRPLHPVGTMTCPLSAIREQHFRARFNVLTTHSDQLNLIDVATCTTSNGFSQN